MAPKRKPAKDALPIKVNFVGNYSIDWQPILLCVSDNAEPESALPRVPGSAEPKPPYTSAQLPPSLPTKPQSSKNDTETVLEESQSSDTSSLPTTDEELKNQFVTFLRKEIRHIGEGSNNASKLMHANKKKQYLALLAVVLDSTSRLMDAKTLKLNMEFHRSKSLESYFRTLCDGQFLLVVEKISQVWGQRRRKTEEEAKEEEEDKEEKEAKEEEATSRKRKRETASSSRAPSSSKRRRSRADKNAQENVPTWYEKLCVLSGDDKPEGAHIVPVRSAESVEISFWNVLRQFWPSEEIEELAIKGRETRNILPLSPSAHDKWNQYMFALRPIEHPTDPRHKIYIQMVWLRDLDKDGGLARGGLDRSQKGKIVDFRRLENGLAPFVEHGDVYELVTADPEERPLPCLRLLQIQYGVHKLRGGMRAAGALEIIFSGDPPDDDQGSVPEDVVVPEDWDFLLDAAIQAGVLDHEEADQWGRALSKKAQQQAQHQMLPCT